MRLNPPLSVAILSGLITLTAGRAEADISINGTSYTESSKYEFVISAFTKADGGFTLSSYSGYVEVAIVGTGMSDATSLNDAFYVYTNASGTPVTPVVGDSDPGYYQLAYDTKPLVGLNPARDVTNFIAYDVNAGMQVKAPYAPAYQSSHFYDFVLPVGTGGPSQLHFGVSDGDFADNSGSYSILVTQLVATPEPGTIALFVSSLPVGLACWLRRRKRA